MFVGPALILGAVSYLDERDIVSACLIGVGCGVACSFLGWRRISAVRRGDASSPEIQRVQVQGAAQRVAVSAATLLVFAVIAVAAHSLPLLMLGVVLSILAPFVPRVWRR
jgi:NhaP-type Na+/H+ or K+/H+ antiporter